ncbi:hypothetical protein D3C72_2418550 [compost metagenome]
MLQRLQIRLVDAELRQRMLHRAGDALTRVGQGAVEVEEDVLVVHGQPFLVGFSSITLLDW